MRVHRSLLRVLIIAVGVALGLVAAPLSEAAAATLSGTVGGQLPGQGAEPLAGATVTATPSEGGEAVASTTTGGEGQYALEVPSGVFEVRVSPKEGSGFEATTIHKVEVGGSRELNITLSPSEALHITGTLLDAAGDPVSGTQIIANTGETPTVSTKTAADGSYSLTVAPYSHYELVAFGSGGAPGLPAHWSFATSTFPMESDREIDMRLPPTARFTVEVLGAGGAPLPGAAVSIPNMSAAYDLGGITARYLGVHELEGHTDEQGRATFTTFAGESSQGPGSVTPAAGSGYGYTTFKVPPVEEGSTVVVSLAGGEEEEGDKEPPLLKSLGFEPDEFDTSSTKVSVNVVAQISDQSGFAYGSATFRSPDGEEFIESSGFEHRPGAEIEDLYEAIATFPQGSEPGKWLVWSMHLVDKAGNEITLGPEQLNERGFPFSVTVLGPASPPVVTEISPNSGPETGGTKVLISGSGFNEVIRVDFGASEAEFVVQSPESIVAYAPPGTGNVGVAVTTPAGTSGEVNYSYTPAATVTLTSSPNPSIRGQKVTFTAKVTPSALEAPTPLGTVAFVEGSTTLGVANLNKGTATLNTTTLGAGTHPVVAEYSGDAHYGAGQSAPVKQVVDKATTSVTLSSSLNPAPFGSSATLKAHVAPVAPGAGTPAGTVTFREGETVLDTVQLSAGNASLALKSLPPGSHSITASYSGDANDEPSAAGPFAQTITKSSTELSLTSTLNPAPFGSSATLKATVKAVGPGGGTPAGTVTFREGETVLATIPLSSGSAKYALKTTAPGEHEITATYSGEADYEGSAGALVQEIVPASTELTLTSSKNPAPHGSSGTLKATVKAVAPGAGTPTGTVTFREGETVLAIVPLSGNAATYPLKALAVGTHEITATYNGSGNYKPSQDTIGQVITP